MQERKSYINYVCDKCFQRLTKCNCQAYPRQLIHVDYGIQHPVRVLYKKRYIPCDSCESHYGSNGTSIYISFLCVGKIDTLELPQGWRLELSRQPTLRYMYKRKQYTEEEFEAEKSRALNDLYRFVDELPVYTGRG